MNPPRWVVVLLTTAVLMMVYSVMPASALPMVPGCDGQADAPPGQPFTITCIEASAPGDGKLRVKVLYRWNDRTAYGVMRITASDKSCGTYTSPALPKPTILTSWIISEHEADLQCADNPSVDTKVVAMVLNRQGQTASNIGFTLPPLRSDN